MGRYGDSEFAPRDERRMQPDSNARQRKTKKAQNNKALAAKRPHKNRWFWRVHLGHRGMDSERCYMKPVLNKRYDAYYCPKHLLWLEERCDPTKKCEICAGRPSVKKTLEAEQK